MIRIDADFSEVDRELSRLDHVPMSVHLELEAILALAFGRSQQEVHVITGSLEASGTVDSDLKNDVWKGTIEYGGPAPGFAHDPVLYAEYEQRRGQSHDFMASTYPMDSLYGKVVEEHVKGKKK